MIDFKYEVLRRPRRRTASISVKPDCTVQVLVPSTLPDQKVVELINRKDKWIRSKIQIFQEIQRNSKQKEYISGESFTYLGRNYRLKIVQGGGTVKLMNGRFYVGVPPGCTQDEQNRIVVEQLTDWYKSHAVKRFREKAVRYAKQMGVKPHSVGVKDYQSRWGSCHCDGRVYFNWRVIVASHSIVDYVVVHELAHLVHHDHSQKFWKLVESILPDYTERKQWLKINGNTLMI